MGRATRIAAVLVSLALTLVTLQGAAAPVRRVAARPADPAHLAAAKLAEAQAMINEGSPDAARFAALLADAQRLSPMPGHRAAALWRAWAIQTFGNIPRDSSLAAVERAQVLDTAYVRDDTLRVIHEVVTGVERRPNALRPPMPGGALVPLDSPSLGDAASRMDPADFPRVLKSYSPIDPRGYRKSNAMLVVHADIERNGRLGRIHEVLGAEALKDAAAEAVRKWTFEPMHAFGHAIDVLAEIPVEFVQPGRAAPEPAPAPASAPAASAPPTDLPPFGQYVYVEVLPEAVTHPAPAYPTIAREAGVDGTVMVQVLVGTDGLVKDTRIVKSIPMLDGAARDCAIQYVFKPALSHDKPVAVWVAVPVKFALH